MTKVIGDVENVLGVRVDGFAQFWAPTTAVHMGTAVVPDAESVPINDGAFTAEVTPGRCRIRVVVGSADALFDVNVPDQPEIMFSTLIEGVVEYEPAVVSKVARLVDEARRITSVLGSAEQIKAWTKASSEDAAAAGASASAAAGSEAAAVAKAGEASDSAQAAKVSEIAAKASETTAAGSASAAASDRAAAGVSAAAAKSSEDAAKVSETAAKQSETSAASSATVATDARDSAQAYAGGAQTQAHAAQSQADRSKAEADRAATSAQQAADVAASGIPDATASTKGKVLLAGDLAGTADAPTVPKLASKADLVGGQVPTSQLPAVALVKPQSVVDRAGMLALEAQEGDVAVITSGADKGTYMLGTGSSSTFGSWVKLVTPDAPVQSVNGQTGTVNLTASNVGAASATHTHAVADVNGLQAALDSKANTAAMNARPALFSGTGAPPATITGAVVGDWWLNTTTMELSKITGV